MIIAFSGIDGSGKTALARRAREYLCSNGRKAAIIRVYAMSIFFSLGRLAGMVSKNLKKGIETGMVRRGSAVTAMLRRLCFRLDILIFKLTAGILKFAGADVVCDRYLYDTLVHMRYLKIVNDRQFDVLFGRIPQPQLPVLLYLDHRTAQEREKVHDALDYYREKQVVYRQISDKIGFVVVDSGPDIETVWLNVKNAIEARSGIR